MYKGLNHLPIQYILKPLPNSIRLVKRISGVGVGLKFPNLGNDSLSKLRFSPYIRALKSWTGQF